MLERKKGKRNRKYLYMPREWRAFRIRLVSEEPNTKDLKEPRCSD